MERVMERDKVPEEEKVDQGFNERPGSNANGN